MFPDEESKYIWRKDSLRNIIRNRVYCGDTVNCKVETIFKTKKHPATTPDKWIIVENTHEPLVSREVWNRANEIMAIKKQDYLDSLHPEPNMFIGLLRCGDCGKAMSRQKYTKNLRIFVCSSYLAKGVYKCSYHNVFEDDLIRYITEDIRKYAKLARENREELISKIIGVQKNQLEGRPDMNSEAYKKLEQRMNELNKVFDKLYEDHLQDRITYENFERLSRRYQEEQNDVRERMKVFEDESNAYQEKIDLAAKAAENLAKYAEIEKLTKEILYALVERIEIFEPKLVDGALEQRIKVFYRFAGSIEPIDFMMRRTYKMNGVTKTNCIKAARIRAKEKLAEREEAVKERRSRNIR